MENASKALIIAGAILLAILLISLGIMIYTQAQDTVNNSGMSDAEIQAFNSKFLKYEGSAQKGTVVKSMVQEILANNAESSNKVTTAGAIEIKGTAADNNKSFTTGIDTKKTYNVTISYANGRVSVINIAMNP